MSAALENITITYGDTVAVSDLTASFPSGSTGLLGPNGAGKSSLIRGLLGLVPFASGRASILGKDVAHEGKYIRQIVGYMPEEDCLIPGLSGIEMVRYIGELCGMPSSEAMQRAHEVLYIVGLEEARYRKVHTYSSGMRQRIKLAQAIVHDPALLFLDEPTSGLDPRGRQEMLDLIRTIATTHRMSIVLASHILVDVERTCQYAVIMHQGRIMKQGEMDLLKGAFSGTLTLRVTEKEDELRRLLTARGCTCSDAESQGLDVHLPDGKDSDIILTAALECGAQIRKMVPSISTLEDVFIKLISGDKRADL